MNSLKTEADSQSDSDKQNRLLSAAKLLADATARMVEAAKVTINYFILLLPIKFNYCQLSH